ncbi:MAG: tetratricopeptide repeat protein [Candidatus Promineifilaceae bacterium]|nr:tetratricopeptide repeat protein [Candidatus Promineifilaceae bacterium]
MSEENDDKAQQTAGDQIDIAEVSGGTVAVGRDAQAIGTLIKHLEEKNIAGDYVERQEITNTILVVGSAGLDELTAWLAENQGANLRTLQQPGAPAEHSARQIAEVVAAQQQTAAQGVPLSPQAAYNLGMLAAQRRDYETALDYFQEAGRADPGYSDAYEAIAWLQQSLATQAISQGDADGAWDHLAKARAAAEKSDALDLYALALRGYIAKSMAQLAGRQLDGDAEAKYYREARRYFEHIVTLDPDNAAAYNGLANIYHASGDFDGAIAAGKRAVKLLPNYAAAFHDLALIYEDKWRTDQEHWKKWCAKAIEAWREAYRLAPDDPAFSPQKILQIGQRIRQLEATCG